jgi:hypothetical protein
MGVSQFKKTVLSTVVFFGVFVFDLIVVFFD